jgi:ferredoxin--NADP+ reductase
LLTGPTGDKMILPLEATLDNNFIFVSTGTGIAPFRALTKYLTVETLGKSSVKGTILHFAGVRNNHSRLYMDDFVACKDHIAGYMKTHDPHSIRETIDLRYVLSREDQPEQARFSDGGPRFYVQDAINENMLTILDRLENKGAHIYFCGLKSMMDGIMSVFDASCRSLNLQWDKVLDKWKSEGRWHVGVYSY